jgi:hypothetical protein
LAVRATILKPRICDLSVLMERFTQSQGQQSGLTVADRFAIAARGAPARLLDRIRILG